jgi:hypothetical protein
MIMLNSVLQKIALWSNEIGVDGIAEAIKINSVLQKIDLSNNCFGAEGCRILAWRGITFVVISAFKFMKCWEKMVLERK